MRILRKDTAALLIDVQERLLPVVSKPEETLALTTRLIKGLNILEIPIIPVRQYPKGLGDYPQALHEALGEHVPSDKLSFSAWETEEIAQRIAALDKKTLLVFGMEAHICVLQTAIDLIDAGFNIVLVTDCVDSRKPSDLEIALRRTEQEGALLTTSESLLFELQRKAGTDTFKQISALIK